MSDPGVPAAILEKRAALIAQCPSATRLPEEEAAKLPIHVAKFGTSGPRVLIIHGGVQGGIGGGPATFAKQSELAEKGWQVEIVDRPGFGQSPSRGIDDMEADAVWVAEMLGEGAHLVGHSWGGATALLAAARRPEAVRSLILVEPALQGLAMTDPEIARDPAAKMVLMGTVVGPLMQAQTPREYAIAFTKTIGTTKAHISSNVEEIDEATMTRLGCSLLQANMAQPPILRQAAETVRASGLSCLVISGGWSSAIDAVGESAARLIGGRLEKVESPNHFPQFENPNGFNATVDAFLRGNI